MGATETHSLADLVEQSFPAPGEDVPEESARSQLRAPAPDGDDLHDVSAELSALLAELARTPEAEVDVAAGWTPNLKEGDLMGRFELKRELGRGGFGVVWEAHDRELGRPVAFKAVRPGRRIASRGEEWLRAEAEAVARLNHPNIVTLHDFGRGPTGPYLIFELLRGETLGERLRRGPLPLEDAVRLGVQIARVLEHAHRAGVVHRDLKPGNVFLCDDGVLKVLDFGLAYLFGRGGAVSGGTPAYMAPEQRRSEPGDERTDLFALGVLLHQMISGAVPYRADRDHSEALEPGPPPLLPKEAAPARLRRAVARMIEKDPADRPASAAEVLGELVAVEQALSHRWTPARRVWAAAFAASAVVAGYALYRGWLDMPPPGSIVVVADFENGTGERELDGLSGLLVTSLEQSRRFHVLTRSRLLALLKQIGKPEATRIDEPIARELAQVAGARILLVGSARRAGATYALELRAVDPRDGRLFALRERAPDKADVLGALDRLSDGARRALRERAEDIRTARIDVAQAVTPDVDAYQAYFEGVDCMERPSRVGSWVAVGRCAEHFRVALALDPTFALAHYQLAFLLHTEGRPQADVDAHMSAALRSIDRIPPKEAAMVRAWQAHVERRDEEALAAYTRVLEQFPDDTHALYLAGYVLYQQRTWAEAVPYFEKVLSLDPDAEWPLDHLVTSLAMLRRWDALRERLARIATEPARPARRHATVRGLAWLGDLEGATDAARRAVQQGDGDAASLDLATALFMAGELGEAQAVLERVVAARSRPDPAAAYGLARALAAQGRRREGLQVIERVGREAEAQDQAVVQYARAMYVAGDFDPQSFWREAAKVKALKPAASAGLAVVAALLGDLDGAAELARGAPESAAAREEHEALVEWRRGEPATAAARLAKLETTDPWPEEALPPAYLLAEVSGAMGDWRGTLTAVDHYRSLWPRGVWQGWIRPRVEVLSALAHERLGEKDLARAELDRLVRSWEHADPGFRLVREVRTLRERIEP